MISVVIPFRDRIKLALEAVASVKAQTYGDVEIILVDDGSTESISIDGVRYLRQENRGAGAARNLGVAEANGEWIAFLDSDDLFLPDKLEKQLAHLFGSGADISHTSYDRVDESGSYLGTMRSGAFSGGFPEIIGCCPIATPTVMGKAEIFKRHPFPETSNGEDCCLWIKLASLYRVSGMFESLTRVRVGKNSSAINRDKMRLGLANIISYCQGDEALAVHRSEIRRLEKALARL
jgi:glycosyltransferase involved in cell wall biosynthesis